MKPPTPPLQQRPRARLVRVLAASLIVAPAILAATPGAERGEGPAPSTGTAVSCESLTGAVVTTWNDDIRPEIDQYFSWIQPGQAVRDFRDIRSGLSVSGRVSEAAIGYDWNEEVGRLTSDALNHLLGHVQSAWSTLGPQGLEIPQGVSGTITPVVGTTRMFITPPNLTHERTRITVTKTGGRQRADVVICKASYEDPGQYTFVRGFDFDNGVGNIGDSQSVTINNSLGDYFTIKVRKNVGTNSFKYRIETRNVGPSVVD